jgi:hypothetical protein
VATRPRSQRAAPQTTPDRAALRAELEDTRLAFHALLNALSDADLRRHGTNPTWTIKEELWHVTFALGFQMGMLRRARQGRNRLPVPIPLRDWVSERLVRLRGRRATRQSLARRYDAAHAAFLAVVDSIKDDEWQRGARFFGGEFRRVAELAQRPAEHFAEHEAAIRQALSKSST